MTAKSKSYLAILMLYKQLYCALLHAIHFLFVSAAERSASLFSRETKKKLILCAETLVKRPPAETATKP